MTEKVALGPQTQRFIHSNAARIYQCDICATRPLVISSQGWYARQRKCDWKNKQRNEILLVGNSNI